MSTLAILISLLAVILILLAPIALLAILKLRRQDLSSLLEGNGWAINSRMRLTRKQRKAFSRGGRFPKDAEGTPRKRICRIITWFIIIVLITAGITVGGLWLIDYAAEKHAEAAMMGGYQGGEHRVKPKKAVAEPKPEVEEVSAVEEVPAPAVEEAPAPAPEEAPAPAPEEAPATEEANK